MGYSHMVDDDVLKDIAGRVEKLRIAKMIKDSELEAAAGVSRKTLYNFRRGAGSISLRNLIRILRALGELERLEQMFPQADEYSPLEDKAGPEPKRVRGRRSVEKGFRWGDEQ